MAAELAVPGDESVTSMPRPLPGWVAHLPAALVFGSVGLRAGLTYWDTAAFGPVMLALAGWLALVLIEPAISRRWPRLFLVHLALEAVPPLLMIGAPRLGNNDFMAVLFAILSMQAMRRLNWRQGAAATALLSLLPALGIVRLYGPAEGAGAILIYTGANAFLASYALANRRAEDARARNERLAHDLDGANRELREALTRREELAAARARHHLARELHDSVTQTVFSMTLATESGLLLLERDPAKVEPQLDHLSGLARDALAQIQTLIAELRSEGGLPGGLEAAIRRSLAERRLPESLAVSVQAEGDGPLLPAEERGLFAIAREAVNNVIKHAGARTATIHLRLTEPMWMEVTDDGRGFAASNSNGRRGVGLLGIQEQADEIGWELTLRSAPGEGTCLRVSRKPGQARSQ